MRRVLLSGLLVLSFALPVQAQGEREVVLRFRPAPRAQIAVWVESSDTARFRTILLTQSVSRRGIGNRPGATQMNSGFRWPYGRRESVLPVWGHRRIAAGGEPFPRVVFNGRTLTDGSAAEGRASVSGPEPRNTRDDYFCLSFNPTYSRRDALDAVSCASVFNSNKGRYLTTGDVADGYDEPYQYPDGTERMRTLPMGSLYPPRRDVPACSGPACYDHADVARYDADVRAILPEIDEVTAATFDGTREQEVRFTVPEEWPDGNYIAYLEIHVEGDYNEIWNDETYPTPEGPAGQWDSWAITFGYPYRGQPSTVFRIPFRIDPAGIELSSAVPWGYADVNGATDDITPMDGAIIDDPVGAPGSGADRLRSMTTGGRFQVRVIPSSVCDVPVPPPECSMECGATHPCPDGFVCGPGGTCVGRCDIDMPPDTVSGLLVEPHANEKHSHEWATLSFVVPSSTRDIVEYNVRVSGTPIVTDLDFRRAAPANAASIEIEGLFVPVDGAPGDTVTVDMGGLLPMSHYYVAMSAVDECNDASPHAVAEVTTTPINFTTVTPCFIATAAHGTPLADDVRALRRFRDRHLASSALGRLAVDAYYAVSPPIADAIRERPWLRAAVRQALEPIAALFAD